MYVDSTSTVAAYIQRFRGLARMNEEHDCKVFEEIKFLPNTMVVELHQGLTFKALQVSRGSASIELLKSPLRISFKRP